jgi:hypothetical protein
MLTPPWNEKDPEDKAGHWSVWITGWLWSLAGLVAGAFFAPALLRFVGLGDSRYQDALVIGVSVVAGFLVQLVGWLLVILGSVVPGLWLVDRGAPDWLRTPLASITALVSFALPLAAVGYGLYRYFSYIGPDQRLVTTAAVGGFLVKAFLIPFIKSIITGSFLLWIKNKLGIGQPAKP